MTNTENDGEWSTMRIPHGDFEGNWERRNDHTLIAASVGYIRFDDPEKIEIKE
jgi:hypothetical protein